MTHKFDISDIVFNAETGIHSLVLDVVDDAGILWYKYLDLEYSERGIQRATVDRCDRLQILQKVA